MTAPREPIPGTPSFGDVCRSPSGERLLVVERGPSSAACVPYPPDPASAAAERPASELVAEGRDLPAARVLGLRERSRRASGPQAVSPSPARIRQAMVLCAGLGTRLRPLTLRYPKPAVPFFDGPLVRYSFALLKAAGVERVVINTHHLPDVMEDAARDQAERLGLELAVSFEPAIMGTAGGLRDARRLLRDEPLFLLNGDAFMSLDLGALASRHLDSGALATMAVTPMPPGERYGAVEATADGAVRRIAGHGPGGDDLRPWHFVGAHVLDPRALQAIPADGEQDINRRVYPSLVEAGGLVLAAAVPLGAWADLGTPRRYLDACEDLLTGLCDLKAMGEAAPLSPRAAAALREKAPDERKFVSAQAFVDSSALVAGSVVGPGARVSARAQVVRSALLEGVRLGPGERAEGVVASGNLRLAAAD